MIDPWKFNPLTCLGNNVGKLPIVPYVRQALEIETKIIDEVKKIREEIKSGKKVLIDNSNNLFL